MGSSFAVFTVFPHVAPLPTNTTDSPDAVAHFILWLFVAVDVAMTFVTGSTDAIGHVFFAIFADGLSIYAWRV